MSSSAVLIPTSPVISVREPPLCAFPCPCLSVLLTGGRQFNKTHTELEFQNANLAVFSNAKNYRRDPLVPLVVPTVNLPHLDLIPHQRRQRGLERGFLVCNSNCAVIGLVIPFAALQARFGPVDAVSVVTLQAVSGAGYPGVSSMDMLDNVVPFISGEEDKLETEARKILGALSPDRTAFAEQEGLRVSAACNRVPVLDGHTACVSLRFRDRQLATTATADAVRAALRDYVSDAQTLGCPSAPSPCIRVFGDDEPDRPQPRLDRDLGRGYTVSVGRVREDESGIFDIKFVALSHNSTFRNPRPLPPQKSLPPSLLVFANSPLPQLSSVLPAHLY